jgi:transcriptional regulator with XRE-family HTH domain
MIERLREVRKKLGMKQKYFAEKVGLSQSHYSMMERGEVDVTDRSIKLFCMVYSINEQWLRTGEGGMFLEPEPEVSVGMLTAEEKAVIEVYGKLEPHRRAEVRRIMNDMWELQEYKKRDGYTSHSPKSSGPVGSSSGTPA